MNNTIEIELRYEVLDYQQIAAFLAGAQQLNTKHIVDVYLDTPERELWRRGIFIRIRNDKKLDIKFNRECLVDMTLDRLDYCEEHSFALPLQYNDLQRLNDVLVSLDLFALPVADLVVLKSVNHFDTHYVIDKVRTSYAYNSFTIALDDVADLGTFLEIELMAQDVAYLEQVRQDMQFALHGLNLQRLRAGYCELMVRKHDFVCYQQGRFVMREDKQV